MKEIKRIIDNHIYILKLIRKGSGWFPLFLIFFSVLRGFNTFFMTTWIYQYVINALQKGEKLTKIAVTAGVVFVFTLAYNALLQFKNAMMEIESGKIEKELQKILQKKALSVDLGCFERPKFYDSYVKALSETSQRAMKVLDNFCDLIVDTITVCSIGVLIFQIDPIFVLLAVLPFIGTLLLGGKYNDLKYKQDMKNQEISREKDYVQRVFYLSDYAKELRLTQMYQVMLQKMKQSIAGLKETVSQYGFSIMTLEYILALLYEVGVYFVSILVAVYRTLVSKTMLLGDCFVVINSLTNIAYLVGEFGDIFVAFGENSRFIDNIRSFLEYENQTPDKANGEAVGVFKELELEHVSFSYEGQETAALKDISLRIRAGEKIAIVGQNGSGKTTLIKLLLRFYDPTQGHILCNGKWIGEYPIASYRNQFGTVFQDFQLFSETVAENIMVKRPLFGQQRKDAETALQKADMLERINDLPNKMDTLVGREFAPDGAVFSGGETQKLAIARAIAKDAPVLILDEPSSALDPIAENKMFEAIFDSFRDKTVIYILHRLSSATFADRIYLLENGQIAEQGTHSELIALNGKYADMFHKQAEKYIS